MSGPRSLSARSGGRQARRKQRTDPATKSTMTPGTELGVRFEPLSRSEVERVHSAALDLLARVGMAAPTDRVKELALNQGCELTESGRLLFPRSLVEDTLAGAAKRFTVHGRDPSFDFEARNGTVNFCTGGAAVKMLDTSP